MEQPDSRGLIEEFHRFWPVPDRDEESVVLAVSGGPDSVALTRLCRTRLKSTRIALAHFDHGLRTESAADAEFVARLGGELGYPVQIERDAAASRTGGQARYRRARYDFLRRVAESLGARYVAMAHTADDQAETILHRIVRGTGPWGLAGMPPFRPLSPAVTLIRPLLTIRRTTLLAYLEACQQEFLRDASNQNRDYTRVRIRHELLPSLKSQYNAGIVEALVRLGTVVHDWAGALEPLVDACERDWVVCVGDGRVVIRIAAEANVRGSLLRETLRRAWRSAQLPAQEMDYEDWRLLERMARDGRPTSHDFPAGVRAQRRDNELELAGLASAAKRPAP